MTKDKIRKRFSKLHVFEQDGQRALNKPMMALWAIGQCLTRPKRRLIPYKDAAAGYSPLMRRFGAYGRSTHPEYPFWRLQKDGIWEVEDANLVARNLTRAKDAKPQFLRQHKIHAGFTKSVHRAFINDRAFAEEIASLLVKAHFGNTSLPNDVLRSVGIMIPTLQRDMATPDAPIRDPGFRPAVLAAYEDKCAICQTSIRMAGELIGIEAAHVKWHSKEGVDDVSNGVAMCVRHHSLFDYGAFTISLDYRVIVAETLDGDAVNDWIGRFNNEHVLRPKHHEPPHHSNLEWHHSNVFKAKLGRIRHKGDRSLSGRSVRSPSAR